MFAYHGAPLRRAFFFTLVALTTLFALALLTSVYQKDGLSPLEISLLVLYAVLIAWISFSFWAATIGFIIQCLRRDRYAISHSAGNAPLGEDARTALVMPIHNEDPKRVFAGLQAMCEDLLSTGAHAAFDVYILSDTRDPDIWVEEEMRWQRLSQTLGGRLNVYYRNRTRNSGRKVGNLKDFCQRWGGHYRYFIVLDADSLMTGASLVKMVRIMENNPQVGLLQVPPTPIGKESLFARILQFASSVYGPIFTTGLNFWQLGEGNYWGHNAIIRMQAFTAHCGLPHLPGREPFGGEILSHDFVEAAMLRRAGWQVWLGYDIQGSYEELPPTLIDYARRDRRWCQGNLQHAKLVFARGWHPINRLHFIMGIMSYLASPLWLLFLVMTGADAYIRAQKEPVYFFDDSLFPIWPESYAVEMTTVLVVTLALLFLPKALALALLLSRPEQRRAHGGGLKATLSVFLETLTSALLAPVLMLFQTKFVLAILSRRNINWAAQQRDDHQTGLLDALAAHSGHTILGLFAAWLSYHYIPDFFWWFTPVLLGLLLSAPLSMLLSNQRLGRLAKTLGLFLITEEKQPPAVFERQQFHQANSVDFKPPGNCFLHVITEPPLNALHLSLLPPDTRVSTRQRHYLQGLVYQLLEDGADTLTAQEKRALLSHRETLHNLHLLSWSLPRLGDSFGRVPV
jgi:membrane glycosyltransferase